MPRGISHAARSGVGGGRLASVREHVRGQVLPDFYCELIEFIFRIRRLSTERESEINAVVALLDRVAAGEGQISVRSTRSHKNEHRELADMEKPR